MIKCKSCDHVGEIEEFKQVSMCPDNVGHGLHEEYTYKCPTCGEFSEDFKDPDSLIIEAEEYTLEVYELHSSKYTVFAGSLAEAIDEYTNGNADMVDNSQEFIETDDTRGYNGIREIETPDGDVISHGFIEEALKEEKE